MISALNSFSSKRRRSAFCSRSRSFCLAFAAATPELIPSTIWALLATALLLPIRPTISGPLSRAMNSSPMSGRPPAAYQFTLNLGTEGFSMSHFPVTLMCGILR